MPVARDGSSSIHQVNVSYIRSRPWRTRRFTRNRIHIVPQFIQEVVVPIAIDADIANCMFTLTKQVLDRLQVDTTMWRREIATLDLLCNHTAAVCVEKLKVA